jgi:hypothetical protein
MLEVIHLTTVHGRGDVRIFHKQCLSLAAAGYRVTLVVQDGRGDESRDGVRIVDLGSPPSGRVRRILGSPWRAYRRLCEIPADLIHFHDPELLPLGWLLKRGGRRVIYDAHEDVPRDILAKHWIPAAMRKALSYLFEKLENVVAARLDAVIGATPFIAARFLRIHPRAIAVNNYPVLAEFQPAPPGRPFSRTLCYVGAATRVRGISELIQSLDLLGDVSLVLCGPFESKAYEAELKAQAGWRHVDYRGVVGRDETAAIMAAAEIGVVTFLPTPNHVDAQPNKMFEYMAAGLPILASDFPLWRRIVEGNRCGLCVDPASPAAIARGIGELLADEGRCRAMGRAGRKLVEADCHWLREAQKLVQLYAELT